MHVIRLRTTEDLERLAPEWNRLASGIPFRTWQWLFHWWQHYDTGKSLYTLAVFDDAGVLVGAAPWFLETRARDGRVIQFLGSGHVCTEYLTILSVPEHGDEVVSAIATWLLDAATRSGETADHWDLLDFDAIPVGDVRIEALTKRLHAAGCTFNRRPTMNCWRMPLPPTWDELAARVRPSHAKQVRKVRRRVFDAGRGVVRTARNPAELEIGMRILVELHQLRWKSQGEPGCFASPEFDGFLHAAAADLLSAGMLDLSWLELDGRPVAAEFIVSSDRTLYVYQGGLDPAARNHSPGHALISSIFLTAMDAGCEHVDFLRGDEPYKAKWGAQPHPTERIRIAPDRIGPQFRNRVWFAGEVIKGWVKQGLSFSNVP